MSNWNIAEAICQLAESKLADQPALIHEDCVLSFAELRARAEGIASWLDSLGLPELSHVGHYLRNSNAYMEMFTGAGLVGFGHVNVNYRYLDQELIDLCNSLDIRVLIYDAEFAERVAAIKPQLTETVGFIEVPNHVVEGRPVDDNAAPVNDFAVSLTELYGYDSSNFQRRTSSDDLVLITTGGTTGLPKGTQWRHEDLWFKMNVSKGNALMALDLQEHPASMDEHIANVESIGPQQGFLSLSPLMHGAGLMMAMVMMAQGSALVTMGGRKFDPDATLETIRDRNVGGLVLVGDAFAMPMVEVLERRADDKLLAPLKMLVSSGASLSDDSKAVLLKHNPELVLFDTLGSTEASGYAISTPEAGVFTPLPTTRVLDENLQDVVPGSDTIGMAYSGGYQPIGYYKAPEKSAETFVEVDGQRYVKTGDRCTVREDGKIVLLGRDSTVINTGGEKVYTVEVERVLVDHPSVTDALVVGLPHPRFGKQVVAVVEGPNLDESNIDVAGIQAHTREHLADYKVPKLIFAIDDLKRAPNGKPDYVFVTGYAEERLAEL